jgi:hypothetical protein
MPRALMARAIVGQVGARETGTHHKLEIPRQDLFDIVAFTGIRMRATHSVYSTPLLLISPWSRLRNGENPGARFFLRAIHLIPCRFVSDLRLRSQERLVIMDL